MKPRPFDELLPATTVLASIVCAVVALWHPWTAFIGAAFAAITPIRRRGWAMAAYLLNILGFIVGGLVWLIGVWFA